MSTDRFFRTRLLSPAILTLGFVLFALNRLGAAYVELADHDWAWGALDAAAAAGFAAWAVLGVAYIRHRRQARRAAATEKTR